MAEIQVPSEVSKVTLGGDTVWQNSGGWVPLVLPEGLNGTVLFRDNGDGTASLAGGVRFLHVVLNTKNALLNAPEGYKFFSGNFNYITSNQLRGIEGYLDENGKPIQINAPVVETVVSYDDGNLQAAFKKFIDYQDNGRSFVDIIFSQAMSSNSGEGNPTALQINIEKV